MISDGASQLQLVTSGSGHDPLWAGETHQLQSESKDPRAKRGARLLFKEYSDCSEVSTIRLSVKTNKGKVIAPTVINYQNESK